MLRAAFPDLHAVIHDQLAEGDKVMTRKSFSGTHRGTFWGIPPTGKQVTIDLIDILRIADGQMVEHWNLVDWMGLMQQLQTTPPTGTTRRMTRRKDTPTPQRE
jgi:predicted ester cyclase